MSARHRLARTCLINRNSVKWRLGKAPCFCRPQWGQKFKTGRRASAFDGTIAGQSRLDKDASFRPRTFLEIIDMGFLKYSEFWASLFWSRHLAILQIIKGGGSTGEAAVDPGQLCCCR